MTRIGVTGHMDLTSETVPLVRQAIAKALTPHLAEGLTGVSCIAAGADSIFADVVLELGGELEVILPAVDYRERKVKPDHAELFDSLVVRATKVNVLPSQVSNRQAYEAANESLVGSVERLVAVWDGGSPADQGGAGAVVRYARSRASRSRSSGRTAPRAGAAPSPEPRPLGIRPGRLLRLSRKGA